MPRLKVNQPRHFLTDAVIRAQMLRGPAANNELGPKRISLKEYEADKAKERAALPSLINAPVRTVVAESGLQVLSKDDNEETLYGMGKGGESKKGKKKKNQRGANASFNHFENESKTVALSAF